MRQTLRNRFSVDRELGDRGLSRVFLAEEHVLRRRVVIKVLPPEMAGQLSEARFIREIGLAAQLQHPHIVPLLAAGQVDGIPCYTMPHVNGESASIAAWPGRRDTYRYNEAVEKVARSNVETEPPRRPTVGLSAESVVSFVPRREVVWRATGPWTRSPS